MFVFWYVLRNYVNFMFRILFFMDESIVNDKYIQDFVKEVKIVGFMFFFLEFKMFDVFVDVVIMCIYIVFFYYSVVNYLQNFYQVFVVFKFLCLCKEFLIIIGQFCQFNELDLVVLFFINR